MVCKAKSRKKPKQEFRKIYLNEYNPSSNLVSSERIKRISTYKDSEVHSKYPRNVTKTSKYTFLNFLPVALFQHFSKYTNFYFLIMTVLWLIPAISPFTISSVITPISFITLVSLIREGAEDWLRHKSDK